MVKGLECERFLRYEAFCEANWVDYARSRGTPWSVLLNVSYHMKHKYTWVLGGDLNSFRDIKPFMK